MDNKLPKNWVVSNIEDSIEILDSKRKPVSATERAKRIGDVPYYGATGVAGKIDDFIFNEELVLLGEDGAPFLDYSKNVAYLISGKSWVNNHAHVLKAKSKVTSNQFLLHYLNQFDYTNYVGGTTRLKLNQGYLKSIPFPLPPLVEQQRIVAKLDVLFNHLDVLKTRLNNIPQLLKNFRQAVLTQAVTGKLTEEWREGKDYKKSIVKEEINDDYCQYDIPEIWVNSVIQNIGSVKGGKRLPKGEKLLEEDTGYPYIRARDLKKGTVLIEKLMYLSKSVQEKIKRYIVSTDDVYITIVGAKIGDAGIIPKEMNGANLTENAAKITDFVEGLNAKYFSLFLRSSVCQVNIQNAIMSAAQGKLALTRIKSLPIYLPPKEEQTEIVNRVEALFAKADKIEAQYQNLKTKIDSLPQAILAKAFKGELVEQLDSDGDAKELLEEIKKLKAEIKVNKKKKVVRKSLK